MSNKPTSQQPAHRGLVIEMRPGESVSFEMTTVALRGAGGVDSEKIVLILEQKHGQRARLRIQADQSVRVGKPVKQAA